MDHEWQVVTRKKQRQSRSKSLAVSRPPIPEDPQYHNEESSEATLPEPSHYKCKVYEYS